MMTGGIIKTCYETLLYLHKQIQMLIANRAKKIKTMRPIVNGKNIVGTIF